MIDPTQPLTFEETVTKPEEQINNSSPKTDKPWLFQKGQSGNPNGRPPGTHSLSTIVKQRLSENPGELKEIIQSLFDMAKKDVNAIKLIWQYMDGMPQQNLDLKGQIEQIVIKRAPTKKQTEKT